MIPDDKTTSDPLDLNRLTRNFKLGIKPLADKGDPALYFVREPQDSLSRKDLIQRNSSTTMSSVIRSGETSVRCIEPCNVWITFVKRFVTVDDAVGLGVVDMDFDWTYSNDRSCKIVNIMFSRGQQAQRKLTIYSMYSAYFEQ